MNSSVVLRRLLSTALTCAAFTAPADDWGLYSIIPASAPTMALEAVYSSSAPEAIVSIGKPNTAANQKWVIVPKGENLFSILPSVGSPLALSVAKGEAKNGAAIVLEKDKGEPSQLWSLNKQEGGSYTLTPKHAPKMGLDDFGGNAKPGAKIDLWENKGGDKHLQWFIKPLAGSPIPVEAEPVATSYVAPEIKPEEVLPGITKQTQFNQSKVFPGTVRDVTVFIPAQ
jgi:hypothetical protein